MSAYSFNAAGLVRNADGAFIPSDPRNTDYAEYLDWVEHGNVADPYVAPPVLDKIDRMDILMLKVLLNHENRIRTLESKAPITMAQLKAALRIL